MRAVFLMSQADARHPLAHEPSILTGADVPGVVAPARKDEIVQRTATTFQPSQDAGSGTVEQLELNRSTGLLLDDDGPRADPIADHEITDVNLDEVATPQLTVNGKVEHSPISQSAVLIQSKSNGPDLLRLQCTFCAELLAGVPRAPLGCWVKLRLSHRISPMAVAAKGRIGRKVESGSVWPKSKWPL
jgi:hypothetical protein